MNARRISEVTVRVAVAATLAGSSVGGSATAQGASSEQRPRSRRTEASRSVVDASCPPLASLNRATAMR